MPARANHPVPFPLRPPGAVATVLRGLNHAFTRVYHRVDCLLPPQLPDTGPAILAPNHTSGLDPLIVQSRLRRHVRWMMAAEYLEVPVLGPLFRAARIIPVARDGRDSTAIRTALRLLAAGEVLGVFPEGRIEPVDAFLPYQPGVAQLALRAGVSIHPVYLTGTQRGSSMLRSLCRPQRACVDFGAPLNPEGSVEHVLGEIERSHRDLKTIVRH